MENISSAKRFLALLSFFLILAGSAGAQYLDQNTDDHYRMLLSDAIAKMEQRYHVRVKYDTSMVKGIYVNYAMWYFRGDPDSTLSSLLKSTNLQYKMVGPKVYKLQTYQYYRWPVEDGWHELDRIAAQYHNKAEWEQRKDSLRKELYQALQLSPLPSAPEAKPIITPERIYDGYSVENIAIEILPGLYINGSLYRPLHAHGKLPLMLSPDGHWAHQRYRPDCQIRCATLARLGCMAFSYDLFAWGESLLQFKSEDHARNMTQTIQTLGAIRILDYFCSLKETDTSRVGMSGGSGGGSHTDLMTALDDRIKISAPVVSVSSYFYGGCPGESGMPIYLSAGGTDPVELAAMAAPHPQLLVSDGHDWTAQMPEHDFPYLQKIYGYYGDSDLVSNVHLSKETHDYGPSKRLALYRFVAKYFHLDLHKIETGGKIDESEVTVEKEPLMYVFGDHGQNLPKDAVHDYENLVKVVNKAIGKNYFQ